MSNLRKWEVFSEEDISPSKWFPLFKQQVKLHNGKIEEFYISKLGNVAMVVAITDKNEVVFVRKYKHGAGEILLELPAGRIDKNTPEEAAIRELQEETGFVVENLIQLGITVPSPTKDTTRVYGFLAKNVKIQKEQKLDSTENIEIVLVPISQINEKIIKEEIKGSDVIAQLALARLRFPELFV